MSRRTPTAFNITFPVSWHEACSSSDLRRDGTARNRQALFRLLLEWSCVVAVLVFLYRPIVERFAITGIRND
jgi:hypothetical protein